MLRNMVHAIRILPSSFYSITAVILFLCPFPIFSQGIKQTFDSLNICYKNAQEAHNDTLAVLMLGEMGKALWGTYPDSAMTYEQEMLRLAERIGYERGKGIAYNNIGYIFRKKSRNDECLEYSLKALKILEAIGDKSMAAWCYHNIGNVYYSRGRFDLALENHFKALRLRESIGEKKAMAWSLSNISDIYRDQGYKDQALEYTQKAVVMFQETDDKHGAAVALNSIGVMLQEQGKYDEAYEKFWQAYLLDEASEHGIGMIWSLRYLGEVSMLQKRYDLAEQHFTKCLSLCYTLKDQKQEVSALLNLGRLQHALRNLRQAFFYTEAALHCADSVRSQHSRQEAYQLLSDLHASAGNFTLAYRFHKQYSDLRDSLFSATSAKKIAELTTQYDADKKKKEIEILTKDNALQEAALKRDALMRNGLIIGVLVLLVIAGLLIQRYRLEQRIGANLRRKNEEITRQQEILENQATEIEITNSQLHEQNLILQQLNTEKNEFLGIVAHDLKNPLTSISMSASALRDYYDRFPPATAKERLGAIIQASQRMATIITNLLDINAIETGNLNLTRKPAPILPILLHTINDYRERAAQKRITLHHSIECDENIEACIDTGVTAEIFDNLVSNAIKYSPFDKQVFVRLFTDNDKIRMEVRDEGPGLSEDDKKRLFGKFNRLSAKPTGGEDSTGLGLSIVKRLVEAMNGRVGCESELGKGAVFFVEFPRM